MKANHPYDRSRRHLRGGWTLWGGYVAALICLFPLAVFAQEASSPVIRKIDIVGNRRIDNGTILGRIGSRIGERLSLETIREDIRAIYGMGRYFENVQAESEPMDGGVRLVFRVEEKPIISGITIEENKELEEGSIRDVLYSRIGSPFDLKSVKKDKEAIKKLYHGRGFYFAQIRSRVEADKNENKKLIYSINEGKKVVIGEVLLDGNESLKAGKIKKRAMETKEQWMLSWLTSAGVYKREILDIDLERIKDYYYSHGYLEVTVGEPQISFNKPDRRPRDRAYEWFKGIFWKKNMIAVTIPISEGEQYRVAGIDFKGNTAIPEKILKAALNSQEDEVFSSEKIRADIQTLSRLFGEKGFAFASISPLTDLNRSDRTVHLTWNISEGQRVFVGEVNITGNLRTRDTVIRREMRFNEGDQYNIAKIDRSKVRIRNTGFFEDVQVLTNRRPGEQVVDLDIAVKEQQTGSLSFGLGASSTQGLVGSFDVRQRNLFGTGRELNVAAMLGGEDSTFSIRFVEPWLYNREVSLGINLFKTISDFDSFEEDATGGTITLGRALDEYSHGSIGLNYEKIDFTDVDTALQTASTEAQSVFGLTLGWRRNTVDNILDPTRGFLARASAKFASFLGDADFNKYFFSDRIFLGGPGKTTLSINGEFGYVDVNRAEDIPVSELFFLGGIESVRGFQYRSLGPRNAFGSLIGARKLVLINTEFYFPVAPAAGLKAFLFFDTGKVFDPASETTVTSFPGNPVDLDGDGNIDAFEVVRSPHLTDGDEWKKSYGIGFYWRSPMGPVKIVWSDVLDEEPFDEVETIQFSLGTAF